MVRTKIVLLCASAGIGLSLAAEAAADARNLSCISDESVFARRVLRDCGPEPKPLVYQLVEPNDPPRDPPRPARHDGNRGSDRGGGQGAGPNGGGGQAGGGQAGGSGSPN